MIDELLYVLALLSALGCGLVGGIFFAFSTFVMTALARLPPAHGIAAMQSINVVVINPFFGIAFFGTGAACFLRAVALFGGNTSGAVYIVAGSLLYLIGTLAVTMACNVPRNDALAALDPVATESAASWASYVAGWTAWNHVRTAAAMAASASFAIALCG